MTEVTKVPTVVEKVAMEDGSTVEFSGKRNLLKTVEVKGNDVYVRLDFRNGATRTFKIPHALMHRAAGHGISQKLGDETAGVKDIDDMVLAVDAQIARLEKGEWTIHREGGNGIAGTSVLMRALMEYSGKDKETVKSFLEGKTQAEKLALRNSKNLKPIIERLEAEKASKGEKVDTEALLSGL